MIALDDVLAAVQECIDARGHADDLTAQVADRVLAFVGPPSSNGVNDGSDEKLKKLADDVKKKFGNDSFDLPYLRRLRSTAFKFPPPKRFAGVKFSLLIVACDPETLAGAMAQARDEGRKCSAAYIRKYRDFKQQEKGAGKSNDITRLREAQRRMIEDARFYVKITRPCASAASDWSVKDRDTLASAGRDLIRAVNQLIWAVEPTPMLQAAE